MTSKYEKIQILLTDGYVVETPYSTKVVEQITEEAKYMDRWLVLDNMEGHRMHMKTDKIVSFTCIPWDPESQAAMN